MYKKIRKLYKIIILFLFFFIFFSCIFFFFYFFEIIKEDESLIPIILIGYFFSFSIFFCILVFLIYREKKNESNIFFDEINVELLKEVLKTNENILIVFNKNFLISWTNNEKLLMDILEIKYLKNLYGTKLEKIFKNEIEDIKQNKLESFWKEFDLLKINFFRITQIKPHIILLKSFKRFKKVTKILEEKEIFLLFISIDEGVLLGEDSEIFYENKKQISILAELELNQILSSKKSIVQTIEFGEFTLFLEKTKLDEFIKNNFIFLNEIVEKIKEKFKVEITFSVGFFLKKDDNYDLKKNIKNWKLDSIKEKYKKSLNALNIAKKRGGDQIVFLSSDEIFKTFGKQRRKIKINSFVKNMQNIFWKKIIDFDDILIVGHKKADFDVFGAGIALKYLLKIIFPKKKIIFLVREVEDNVVKTMHLIIEQKKFDEYVTREFDFEKKTNYNDKNKVIIIVDSNNPEYIDLPIEIQDKYKKIYLDHHMHLEKMNNVILDIVDNKFSSASEIIMFLILKKFEKKMYEIPTFIYKVLLFGILLDTNNLQVNVSKNTFSIIEFITRNNVDIQHQINILKNYKKKDINKIKKINDFNIKLIEDKKIVVLFKESNEAKPETAALMAENFLQDYKIESVFVVVGNFEKIFVSARSSQKFNVQLICSKLGGGGSSDRAAAQIVDSSVDKILKKILNLIKKKL